MISRIGTLQETSLHAALKDWYSRPGDRLEALLESYHIDIIRQNKLIEIQTGNFSALRPKLKALLPNYNVRVIHPIAAERWICRVTAADEPISRRKSPKRGRVEDLFTQLLRLPELAMHKNFSLEIVLIQEEVVWRDDGQGSWRRKHWSVADRRLLQVLENHVLDSPKDYGTLLPFDYEEPFTNQELAKRLVIRRRLAVQITYCLRRMDLIEQVGKRGRFNLYVKKEME